MRPDLAQTGDPDCAASATVRTFSRVADRRNQGTVKQSEKIGVACLNRKWEHLRLADAPAQSENWYGLVRHKRHDLRSSEWGVFLTFLAPRAAPDGFDRLESGAAPSSRSGRNNLQFGRIGLQGK